MLFFTISINACQIPAGSTPASLPGLKLPIQYGDFDSPVQI
jgi:hypothetical protein